MEEILLCGHLPIVSVVGSELRQVSDNP